MNLRFSSTVLLVSDFDRMVAFYRDLLLQECQVDFGNCMNFKCGLSIWKMDDEVPLAQELGRTFDPAGNRNLEFCFETEEFDHLHAHLQEQELNYLHGCIEEPWGQRTLRFYDPEQNLVEVGESIPCFVKRFHQQGLSMEEVSQR